MVILIIFYFFINTLIAGCHLNELKWVETKKDFLIVVGWALVYISLGIPYFLLILIFSFFRFVDKSLGLTFWYQYFFTKRYYNLPSDILTDINSDLMPKTVKSVRDRILKYQIDLVNKRNNFSQSA